MVFLIGRSEVAVSGKHQVEAGDVDGSRLPPAATAASCVNQGDLISPQFHIFMLENNIETTCSLTQSMNEQMKTNVLL